MQTGAEHISEENNRYIRNISFIQFYYPSSATYDGVSSKHGLQDNLTSVTNWPVDS